MNKVKNEDRPAYEIKGKGAEDEVIQQALEILKGRMRRAENLQVTGPADAKSYLRLKIAALEHEVFGVLWLDNRHRLIEDDQMFRGTVDSASVYPREVVKSALARNAAAAILYHNHPSGDPRPSRADEDLTRRLRDVLDLVGVRILDHIIVGGTETISFAEKGLL